MKNSRYSAASPYGKRRKPDSESSTKSDSTTGPGAHAGGAEESAGPGAAGRVAASPSAVAASAPVLSAVASGTPHPIERVVRIARWLGAGEARRGRARRRSI